ncbi:MAG: glycosyltransferase family A protein [Clostridia bacterium]|nr:glycosyltransferase family A protein [Clostridia bacterium]
MKVEVLVTTMYEVDFNKYTQMNLQTDAVLANQTDKNAYAETEIRGRCVKLVSTDTRGVSRNRNLALMHASPDADYLLFADDDLVFVDGYEKLVLGEFEKHPEAEAIKSTSTIFPRPGRTT